jgi:hypothetical protein
MRRGIGNYSPLSPDGGADTAMVTPHVSSSKAGDEVAMKLFGVTGEQMKRTQALLRLGVTEQDVILAERIFHELPASEEPSTKEERLLGLTRSQMSFVKALEILGVSESIIEEERSKQLSALGYGNTEVGSCESELTCVPCIWHTNHATSSGYGDLPAGMDARIAREMALESVIEDQRRQISELQAQLVASSRANAAAYDERQNGGNGVLPPPPPITSNGLS